MTLSVSIITRDEEPTLAAALRSVAPVADQIVLVDTGSTDRTREIARDLGALVLDFPWSDDFSAARNHAIPHLTGDWVLVLDADEELLPDSADELRRCTTRHDALAYFVTRQNLADPARTDLFTENRVVRLCRKIDGVRFTGRIHERLTPPIEDLVTRTGRKVLPSNLRLRHLGYARDLREQKLRRALPLLKLELDDHPTRLDALIEYGRTLLQLADPAGHDVLARAAKQVHRCRNDAKPPNPIVALLLEYLLVTPQHLSQGQLFPHDAAKLAARWFPDAPPLLWALAQFDFQSNRFDAAAKSLLRLIELGRSGRYDRSVPFDPSILGPQASLNLGACYVRLARLDQAERTFKSLLSDPTYSPAASQNLATIAALRKQA